jgi:predicted dehydrogenase
MTAPAVVLGYGSIGRRHAAALAARGHPLAIVNRGEAMRRRAAAEHPGATVVADIPALARAGFDWKAALGVIATWGPGHPDHFSGLAALGVRRMLCEKPLAASVADARSMRRLAQAEGIPLVVNHTIRYAGLAKGVTALAGNHRLGAPVAVVAHGGAACLLTNGIHWLDFAIELFGASPTHVTSTAVCDPINPRAADLVIVGGTGIWTFPEGREATVSFFNGASLLPRARILYRDAALDVEYRAVGGDAVIHARLGARDAEAVALFPQVTRTGPRSTVLHDGPVAGVLTFNQGLESAAAELETSNDPTCGADEGAAAVLCCLGALESARTGARVELRDDVAADWHARRWPIS